MPPPNADSNLQSDSAPPIVRAYATREEIEFITCTKRFLFLAAGRRWGKTDCFLIRAGVRCLNNIGYKYTYTAPSYALAKDQYERAKIHFAPFIAKAPGQPKPEIFFHTGSRIQFRSMDRPKLLRGNGEDEVFIDESQDIKEADFNNVIRALVSDKRGTIVMAGQFRGRDWRYEKWFEKGQIENPEYKSWKYSTEDGIAFQSASGRAELALVREQLPRAVYEQEYMCLPVANQAAVFYPDDLATISHGKPHDNPKPGWSYIAGVDLGWRVDYTAIVMLAVNRNTGEIDCAKAWRQPLNSKHEVNAPFIARELERFNCRAVVDVTGGATGGKVPQDEYIKHYREFMPDLQPFTWTQESKMRLIKHLGLTIERFGIAVSIEFKDTLLKELYAYEFTHDHKTKGYRYGAPVGQHDDLVTALALALWGINCSWYRETGGRAVTGII